MWTKPVLLAPLVLGLSALTCWADSYTITIQPGWNLIANQLDNGGNTLSEILPNLPVACTLLKFDAATQGNGQTAFFDPESGGWMSLFTLQPGEGALLENSGTEAFTVTFTGMPHVPILPVTLYPGLNLLSRQTNDIGTYENIVGLPPSLCTTTRVYRFNAGRDPGVFAPPNYTIYTFQNGQWDPQAPTIDVGEAVWIEVGTPTVTITSQPTSVTVPPCSNSNVTFTVLAMGNGLLHYQWWFNDQLIPGATNATYDISSVNSTNAGSYTVAVGDSCSMVASAHALLKVGPPLVITSPPASATVVACSSVTFTTMAAGNGPLRYQWLFNDESIPGATNASFEIAPVSTTNAGAYAVKISDSCSAVTSAPAFLTVDPSLVITRQPAGITICCTNATNCATFSVTATGTGDLSYQWSVNGEIIIGATSPSYSLCPITLSDNGNQYTVKITNACGSVTSQVATLTVNANGPIVACPADLTVQCDAEVPAPNPAALTRTFDCVPAPVIVHLSDVASGTCPKTIVRTYQATDACGNVSICTQTIIVHQTTPPVFLCASSRPNLVANPGFETYSSCPPGIVDLAGPWFTAGGTPDFFHTCSSAPDWGAPANFVGIQAPHNGYGYAGQVVYSSYREYIETQLLAPLVAGHTYEVSFYVSLAEELSLAVDNLGAYFSTEPVLQPSGQALLLTPQVRNRAGAFLSSTNEWMLVLGIFTALGGENYLTIGNFHDDVNTPTMVVGHDFGFSYYYVDDVAVREGCEPGSTPKIVECGDAWSFDTPSVLDACYGSNATLMVLNTVTNHGYPQVITRTWEATDSCSNRATLSQTVTVVDTTPPVLTCPADLVVCADPGQTSNSNVTYVVTATDNCPGVNFSCNPASGASFSVGTTPVTCIAIDAAGNSNRCVFTVVVNADAAAAPLSNLTRCRGDSATYTAVTSGGGALSYGWSVDGNPIGTGSPLLVAATSGMSDGNHTVQCIVTGECGSVTNRATLTVQSCARGGPCSFTQGFYGNQNGKFNGTRSITLISNLLASAPLVVGKTGTRSLTIPQSAVPLLQQRMPASGTPTTLPNSGDQNLLTAVLPLYKATKFANVFLGQTITLSLNVRLDPSLPAVQLRAPFCTKGVSAGPDGSVGTADDVPITSDVQTFTIPNSVLAALVDSGLGINDVTVRGLLELANRALAGLPTGPASIPDINSAVDAINRGYDGCRVPVDCITHIPLVPSSDGSTANPIILGGGGNLGQGFAAAATAMVANSSGPAQVLRAEGFNCDASKEPGEPDIAGNAGGKPVWWQWTATVSGLVTIQTAGSSFDTLLGVYVGPSRSNLTLIASGDDTPGSLTAAVAFPAIAGTNYLIVVDGFDGACGSIVLEIISGAPRIGPMKVLPGGGLGIGIEGELGRNYVVEGSSDLANWEAVAALENTTGNLQFVDRQARTSSQRFYRVVFEP
jgi:hypothetical protein